MQPVMPALWRLANGRHPRPARRRGPAQGKISLQNAQAHGDSNTNFLGYPHLEAPEEEPREDGEDEIKGARVG
jgi:hypothetical protein